MYQIVKEENAEGVVEDKVYGVLMDFDLSSWTKDIKENYTKTSQQRTGTPPFMAHGLLDGSDALHLYRHDLESLLCVMLILATNYEIQHPTTKERGGLRMRQGLEELPYKLWFGQPTYEALAHFKRGFFSARAYLNLSPDFEDFRSWLLYLRQSFRLGIRARETYEDGLDALQENQSDGAEDEVTPKFDYETLGGNVSYSTLISPVHGLKGKLQGLVVRYDPSLSTSTAQADSGRQ